MDKEDDHNYDAPSSRLSISVSPSSGTVDTDTCAEECCLASKSELVPCSAPCKCQKFSTKSSNYDVPVQKSRLHTKESVFHWRDENVCLCAPQQDFVEWHYKTTKSALKNLKSAFDDGSCKDDFFDESIDGSIDFSTTATTCSRDFCGVCHGEDGNSDTGSYSRRQGTGRRTRSNDSMLRPKTRRSPENLTYLCVRVIDENVMRCEATFDDVFL